MLITQILHGQEIIHKQINNEVLLKKQSYELTSM